MVSFHLSVLQLVLIGVALLVVILALGSLTIGLERRETDGQNRSPAPEAKATISAAHRDLLDRDSRASVRFNQTVSAFGGPRHRLLHLAAAAQEMAKVLYDGDAAGLVAKRRSEGVWDPPWELRRGSSRIPPVAAWQGLDRAFEVLAAVHDDSSSSLSDRARTVEALGRAARQLAEAFPDGEVLAQLAVCTFCGKRGDQVRKMIQGDRALICEECVELCVEVLEDTLGGDWRTGAG